MLSTVSRSVQQQQFQHLFSSNRECDMAEGPLVVLRSTTLSTNAVEKLIGASFRQRHLTPAPHAEDEWAIFISRIMGIRGKGLIIVTVHEYDKECVITINPIWESLRDLILRALSKKYSLQFDIKRGASLKLTDNLVLLLREADPRLKEDGA